MESEWLPVICEVTRRSSIKPVIVGGSAVEFYTGGMYTTGNVDIVGSVSELSDILKSMGFRKEDRFFVKGKVFIDLVGMRLAGRCNEISLGERGDVIVVISVEDLLIDRLCACKWWRSSIDCEQARYLWGIYKDRIDPAYLMERAREEDVSDILPG